MKLVEVFLVFCPIIHIISNSNKKNKRQKPSNNHCDFLVCIGCIFKFFITIYGLYHKKILQEELCFLFSNSKVQKKATLKSDLSHVVNLFLRIDLKLLIIIYVGFSSIDCLIIGSYKKSYKTDIIRICNIGWNSESKVFCKSSSASSSSNLFS